MSIKMDIENVLAEHVSPSLAMHGGIIELLDYNEDSRNVHVRLSGSCAGCSASTITLKIGVLQTYLLFWATTLPEGTQKAIPGLSHVVFL